MVWYRTLLYSVILYCIVPIHCTVWYGRIRFEIIWSNTLQYEMIKYNIRYMIRYDTIWYDTIRYGTMLFGLVILKLYCVSKTRNHIEYILNTYFSYLVASFLQYNPKVSDAYPYYGGLTVAYTRLPRDGNSQQCQRGHVCRILSNLIKVARCASGLEETGNQTWFWAKLQNSVFFEMKIYKETSSGCYDNKRNEAIFCSNAFSVYFILPSFRVSPPTSVYPFSQPKTAFPSRLILKSEPTY